MRMKINFDYTERVECTCCGKFKVCELIGVQGTYVYLCGNCMDIEESEDKNNAFSRISL